MIKKVVVLAAVLVALTLGSAFAYQIDSLGSGALGQAQPPTNVFVNPGGLGDVLLYGYYNVRGQQTFFTVTNTDSVNGVRVRIRFREAETIGAPVCNGSQEVLDFDICLSKSDMWTGNILTDSASGAAKLVSRDADTFVQTSGLAPQVPGGAFSGTIDIFKNIRPNGQLFKFGADNLVSAITADQTREGYYEVIAERQLRDCTAAEIDRGDCSCGDQMDLVGTDAPNALMGHSFQVNVASTETYGYVATALGDFSGLDITSAGGITSSQPNLSADSETNTIDPVNYALTKRNINAIYDLESFVAGEASLVVTFPTKWATHIPPVVVDGECVETTSTPNLDIFDDPTVGITIFDDAENPETPELCEFSPCPPGSSTQLPDEVNVLNFNSRSIFDSTVDQILSTSFVMGWASIDLGPATALPVHQTSFGGFTTVGLPAIAYQAQSFAGGKFSAMLPMTYNSDITQAIP